MSEMKSSVLDLILGRSACFSAGWWKPSWRRNLPVKSCWNYRNTLKMLLRKRKEAAAPGSVGNNWRLNVPCSSFIFFVWFKKSRAEVNCRFSLFIYRLLAQFLMFRYYSCYMTVYINQFGLFLCLLSGYHHTPFFCVLLHCCIKISSGIVAEIRHKKNIWWHVDLKYNKV